MILIATGPIRPTLRGNAPCDGRTHPDPDVPIALYNSELLPFVNLEVETVSKPDDGAWQNYARRSLAMFKIWEAAFADLPKDLVRALGTQYVYFEVTRQALSYP